MSEVKDDPKEVLSILNSLGFVGITAPQLKSFMKDLKLYKKIKERERETWKEEIKRKIVTKQKQALVGFIREQEKDANQYHPEKIISTESPRKADAIVTVKIKHSSRGRENDREENFKQMRSNAQRSEAPKERECDFWMKNLFQNDLKQAATSARTVSSRDHTHRSKSESKESSSDGLKKTRTESSKENVQSASRQKFKENVEKSERRTPRICEKSRAQKRPASASETNQNILHVRTKSTISDPGEIASYSATRTSLSSHPKSFIRPWRLHPEIQKPWKKSDPVALYQKYQEEWKHFPLPGEDKHSAVRWAIRERMMGGDPHPRPAVYKPSHLSTWKKR